MSPWELILGPVFKIIDKVVPDIAERDRQKLEIIKLQQSAEGAALEADLQIALGQIEVNKVEAAQPGIFKGGWRPASGWICVFGLGYSFMLRPLLPWVLTVAGVDTVPPLPAIDTSELFVLLGGLLGLGGFRTWERVRGKA